MWCIGGAVEHAYSCSFELNLLPYEKQPFIWVGLHS